MLSLQRTHKNLGFSLLEILLVCGLLAIIIIGGARYFNAAQNDYRTTKTIQDIKNIREGAAEWVLSQPDYSGITLNTLATSNLIPSDVATGINQWNGNYVLSGTAAGLTLQVTGVSSAACVDLPLKMAHVGSSVGCSSGTFTIRFDN